MRSARSGVQAGNGGVAVQTAAESGPWSGFITHFAPLPDITPEEWKNGSLEFELDGGKPAASSFSSRVGAAG